MCKHKYSAVLRNEWSIATRKIAAVSLYSLVSVFGGDWNVRNSNLDTKIFLVFIELHVIHVIQIELSRNLL